MGYHEGIGRLPEETGLRSIQKASDWATQQRADVSKLELRSRLGRTWENLLLEYFENEMRTLSSAQFLMVNPLRLDGSAM